VRPLNRAERRVRERGGRQSFRAVGCTCDPIFVSIDPAEYGVSYAADVSHEAGCAFGDPLVGLNNLGVLPVLVRWGESKRCER
jgi:hypothetical protein